MKIECLFFQNSRVLREALPFILIDWIPVSVGGAPQQGVGLSVSLSDQRGSLSHWYLNIVAPVRVWTMFFILHLEFYTHQIIVFFLIPKPRPCDSCSPSFRHDLGILSWLVEEETSCVLNYPALRRVHSPACLFRVSSCKFPACSCALQKNAKCHPYNINYGRTDFWMICETIKIDGSMIWINISSYRTWVLFIFT